MDNNTLDNFMPSIDGEGFEINISQEDFNDLTGNNEPQDPVEPVEPVEPQEPTDPAEPTEPQEPVVITPEDVELGDDGTDPKEGESNENADVSTVIYEELAKRNVLQLDKDKESYSWEDIEQGLDSYTKELPSIVAEAMIESFPEKGRQLLDFIVTKGEDLNDKDLADFVNTYLNDIQAQNQTLDYDNEDAVKTYLEGKYKAQGFKESVVTAMIDALDDEDDTGDSLKAEAKKLFEAEKSKSKSKEVLDAAKQQKVEREAAIAKKSQLVIGALKDTGWSEQRVQKVGSILQTGQLSEILKLVDQNPKAIVQLADFASYFDKTTGEFDYSAFMKKSEDKPTKQLKDRLLSSNINSTVTKESKGNPNKKWSLDDLQPIL